MDQFGQLTEVEIINRILKGEKPLYEIIVKRFNSYLYKIGRSYNYNHEDTQDLMQDTYIDAYKNLGQFEKRAGFKTWIIRIMLNNCYRKKQKFSYKNEFANEIINENETPMFSNSMTDIQKEIHSRELGYIIENSLAQIPEDYRIVFSLREINGLNVSETSALLNISETNVKVRLNRAKTMLRIAVEKSYTAEELFDFNLSYCNPFSKKVMLEINRL
ncbi:MULTISPECIES: sigma-70 family RNA polymerase sigma factor [Chryseobacterium]|uniref:RNA polymerase sigma-70 factor, ECF subfamily n=4 Tax=Chryseobacterium TaxID=59732 RepID=A0AAX2IL05_9FLAO|nr:MULTISPECIES: sigma-70 family RNA polymerase sigma factor [Chryseobacterium]AZB29699.1 sigma-70 family RNA polymerase sigma factor [Chryseobacterium balustinum]SFZ93045.1 RNA polymerase sigma-70 factor, ECF subfamily [Chryseobacterium limigenitum]SKB91899.1 RNA polymerase sigma-70 factor, ECF subfamily [Chryseobacterium balustinum]SQA90059.1 Sigma-24 [Chryseobacterium balustinum]SUX45986.1 Sigma-24 [Chryseobacterium indoltheticum]